MQAKSATFLLKPKTVLKSISQISRCFGGGQKVKQCSVRDLYYPDEWSFRVSGPNKEAGFLLPVLVYKVETQFKNRLIISSYAKIKLP